MDGHPVKLYVYDLSRGMARAMSMPLTGRQIGGPAQRPWHTAVVVYGKEHYFGQGLQTAQPGVTPYGGPVEVVDMGITHLPEDVFSDYLASVRERFSPERYHLLDHNCNTFSNEAIQFLTGRAIPGYITNLPADFLQTPFGQQMRPFIETAFGPGGSALSTPTPPVPSDVPSQLSAERTTGPVLLHQARNLGDVNRLLSANRAVALYFTSQGCPPCRLIAPEFRRLMTEQEQAHTKPVVGVTVDTGVAFDVAATYQIRGTPTFMFFVDGQKTHEMVGASVSELTSSLNLLRFTAYPPHPHEQLDLPTLRRFSTAPVLFTALPKVEPMFTKLREFIDTAGNGAILSTGHEERLQALQAWLARWETAQKAGTAFTETPPAEWSVLTGMFLHHLLATLPIDKMFPVLDLVRLLLTTRPGRQHYASMQVLLSALHAATTSTEQAPIPKAFSLVALRCLPPVGQRDFGAMSPRTMITELLVHTLLAQDQATRRAAASLAFNVATRAWELRVGTEHGEGGAASDAARTHTQDDESWLVECASAMVEALREEQDEEIGKWLVAVIWAANCADTGNLQSTDLRVRWHALRCLARRDSASCCRSWRYRPWPRQSAKNWPSETRYSACWMSWPRSPVRRMHSPAGNVCHRCAINETRTTMISKVHARLIRTNGPCLLYFAECAPPSPTILGCTHV
ncbi:PPPDE putative peptidase domain-containing protein [Thamnocephalis sphaerospora]|uniref:PPPDE putative peptidase domain-containing protein n=1 Tax=Thamnocephalis sphaerospora TaxID=78915 RepID=A0A4P9XTZ8_9FUNG|nr:PPPDE putative peptidase domain-containing protein [Thamnocephalis sphaerospora]|eukprot:RKP09685.1 PPPDE putative peptidase domain-containing protein [Thamnocephalis sphaerospora]